MRSVRNNRLYTIGHSDRSIQEFLGLLKAHGIKRIVDIRTIPKSRHNPQFNKDVLAKRLRSSGIAYRHCKALGGLRHAKIDSVNLGWHNASFRGFADYMQAPEFWQAIEKLQGLAGKKRTAVMCAEALPWRCHRSLVADAFVKQKWNVFHIMSQKTASAHKPTSFLRMRKGNIIYPLYAVK